MKTRIQLILILTCLLALVGFTTVSADPAVGDYQSFGSGNWNAKNRWARWDGTAWINPAPHSPSFADGKITILNGHSIDASSETAYKLTINGTITISGTITVTDSIELNSGATLSTSHLTGIKDCLAGSGVKTFSAGANYLFNGTGAQSTGFSGLSVGNPNNITINNSSGVTLDASITVTGMLTFTSGKLITGTNAITIGDAGSVVGAGIGKYVYGNLGRVLGSSGSPTISFDIGDATNYIPVTVAMNSLSAGGMLTAKTTGSQHGSIGSSKISDTKYINRYWTLTNSGASFASYSATFNFVSSDIIGDADPDKFIAGKYNGDSWSYPVVGTKTSTSTQITGETNFGDFAVGEIKTFAITANVGANGTIDPSGVTYVTYGDSLHYTITPNTDYKIDSVLVDGSFIGAVTSYTFTNVTAPHTINAAFFIKTYTLTVNGVNGTVTKIPNQAAYDSASFVQLIAVPDPNFIFKGWSGDLTGTTNPVYIMMDANKNVTVNFAIDIDLNLGWNLASVPLVQSNNSASVIFPGKLADMYKYEGGAYVPAATLEIGKGYWAYYTSEMTETISGSAPGPVTVACQTGWNLIGSREMEVATSTLTTVPAGQILADIYRYDHSTGSYVSASVLTPGEGVWVYVTGACTLTIP